MNSHYSKKKQNHQLGDMSDDIKPLVVAVERICAIPGLSNVIDDALRWEFNSVYIHLTSCNCQHLEVGDDWDYDKLLENCREFLIRSGSTDSMLLKGYKVAKDNLVGSSTYTSSSNISNTFIRSYPWRILHSILGSSHMSNILLNYNGYLKSSMGFIQLFGQSTERSFIAKPQCQQSFSLTVGLYRTHGHIRQLNPIPACKREVIQRIFPQQLESVVSYKKFESKIRSFARLVSKLLSNHQKFDYFKCFDAICKINKDEKQNLSLAVSKKDVVRFCTVTFDGIFPKDIYGSTHNKAVILRNIGFLIFGDKDISLHMVDIMKGIQLRDIRWLGKDYNGNWNKQDHEKRHRRCECFLSWVFSQFFPYLLASFFHITHISSSKELFFFRHATWSNLTNSAIQDYKENNLRNAKLQIDKEGFEEIDFDLNCKFRIMPKKNNEFRVINVPVRGKTLEEQKEYAEYVMKEVKPTKRILSQIRLSRPSRFSRLMSVSDIPVILKGFKDKIHSEGGFKPNLYFIKFDVKECYDTLPQKEIKKAVSEMVIKDQVYFMTNTPRLNLRTGVSNVKIDHVTMDDVPCDSTEIHQIPHTLQFGGYATSLRGEEIISIVESQLKHSYTNLWGESYTRRRGIFQGLHLSSLFCDLVYDRLIEDVFGYLDIDESIVLRLADDFLIISTNKTSVIKSKKMIEQGFPKYGVQVNKVKTFLNVTNSGRDELGIKVFSFCGLEISIKDLSVLKKYDDPRFLHFRSHKKLTQKLLWVYKIRLSNNPLDLEGSRTLLKQVFDLAANTAEYYRRGTISLRPNNHKFSLFLNQLVAETMKQAKGFDMCLLKEIKDSIILAFLITLKAKSTRYRKLIILLEDKMKYE